MPTDDEPHLRYLSSRGRRRRVDARPLRPEALLVELSVIVALWALVAGTVAAFDRPTGGPRHCSFPTSCG